MIISHFVLAAVYSSILIIDTEAVLYFMVLGGAMIPLGIIAGVMAIISAVRK